MYLTFCSFTINHDKINSQICCRKDSMVSRQKDVRGKSIDVVLGYMS